MLKHNRRTYDTLRRLQYRTVHAYLHAPDPDALAAEFTSRDVTFSVPLKDTEDGLRGFELKDTDGYVLFFGRPRT